MRWAGLYHCQGHEWLRRWTGDSHSSVLPEEEERAGEPDCGPIEQRKVARGRDPVAWGVKWAGKPSKELRRWIEKPRVMLDLGKRLLIELSETWDVHVERTLGGERVRMQIDWDLCKPCGGAKSLNYWENTQEPEMYGKSLSTYIILSWLECHSNKLELIYM